MNYTLDEIRARARIWGQLKVKLHLLHPAIEKDIHPFSRYLGECRAYLELLCAAYRVERRAKCR
jgi:hypothetical protein